MKHSRKFLCGLSLTLASLTASCGVNFLAPGQKNSVVQVGFRPGYTPPHPIGYVDGRKVTPGAVRAIGSDHSMQATITLNGRKAVGAYTSGRFSIGNFRPR